MALGGTQMDFNGGVQHSKYNVRPEEVEGMLLPRIFSFGSLVVEASRVLSSFLVVPIVGLALWQGLPLSALLTSLSCIPLVAYYGRIEPLPMARRPLAR